MRKEVQAALAEFAKATSAAANAVRAGRRVLELAQPETPAEGVPGYWVPWEVVELLREAIREVDEL